MSQSIIVNSTFLQHEECTNKFSNETLGSGFENVCNEETDNKTLKEIMGNEAELDDFKSLFNHISLKITTVIICVVLITFTNAFIILVSIYEKYGGDPMKRSLKNQLIAQMGYCMIINNTVCTPLLTWRVIFGPLYSGIAAFNSLCKNISLLWMLTYLTGHATVRHRYLPVN